MSHVLEECRKKYGEVIVDVASFVSTLKIKYVRRPHTVISPTVAQSASAVKPQVKPASSQQERTVKQKVTIHITNEQELEGYFALIANTKAVEVYLSSKGEDGAPYLRQIQQYKTELLKVKDKIAEVDEETTERVAEKVAKCARKRLNNIFLNCSRTLPGKEKYAFFKGLEKVLESYLESIYLYKKEFSVGQKLDDDSISYFSDIIHVDPDNRSGNKIIKGIDIQPRYIKFINEDDEEDMEIMGGYCEI